ncbi:E3 ubiquitin-protein ligase TRIM39-like isoform X9 [Siniperca chuatsi]|uniref:E3 ubiquitin-protein ligase TRIM39-like isoform X9 n=1 Tax=Siniperca chuatsi TaxID=119488 RepID=UPI001CE16800|nr:E3 ubiquitin-protein ligase TRIM39-like isoform X9 [Siniperca chuatsi]
MTPEDLLNTLENLKKEEFTKFKWYLQQPDILEGYQPIKVSELEEADRLKTVNLMVNIYKLHGALKVTKKVLEKIPRNDLVQSLSDTSSGPEVSVDVSDVGETSENRGPSSSQSEDMAAANYLRSEDQFLCSICLDVFTDPVTILCGHNFCKNCITKHWDTNDRYLCPMCKKIFYTRPELHVNTFISEIVAQFRQSAQQEASSSSSETQVSKPGEVPCDVCTGTKLKALKSCLVCLASYCETHLDPHLTMSGLKRHQLIDPVENLEGRMCTKHDKPLELFCKTDQTCVCALCTVLDHKTHEFVPLKEEFEGKKAELGKTEAELQQMIQMRRLKIRETKRSVDLGKEDADREIAEGVQVFTSLKESVERGQANLIHMIKEKQKTTEKQAEAFIKELDQEISELMKRRTEVEQLSRSQDHLHLLQNFQSLNTHHPPPTKDWTEVSVRPPSYEGSVVRAVAQLEETLSKQMKKLLEAELKRVQQYAVDVTLDPDTANPHLILSDDGKQVNHGDVVKSLPENPERFSNCICVLGKQSFSSGRFYFEVQVKGKTDWYFGVCRESIDRKGEITLSPEDGYWTISLENRNEFEALDDPPVRLSLKSQPQKVGVFVDYEEGLVSFYDVDAAAVIYSFTGCSFTEKLFPYFSPSLNYGGKNSAPLIISPVRVN